MAKFIRALAKMGLVQLDEHDLPPPATEPEGGGTDLDALLAEGRALKAKQDADQGGVPAEPVRAEDDAPPPPPVPPASVEGITDDRPLTAIYAEAGVPATPFPAEKLLKMLDGLAAMEPAVRKAAVLAMDAADDTWALADALLDASRKVEALAGARERLDRALAGAEAQAQADLQAQDSYAAQATETIRAQIAELEATLTSEMQQVSEEKARIASRLASARAARASQAARYEGEIERLRSLYPVFGASHPQPER